MNLSRRGFLGALLAAPIAAKAVALRVVETVSVEQPFDPWLVGEIQREAREALADWLGNKMDELMFAYATGNYRPPRLPAWKRERIRAAFERLEMVEFFAGDQWRPEQLRYG